MSKPEDLDQVGVIYGIVRTGTRHLYIGQTINTAYVRFQQHFWKRELQQTPLQQAMARSKDVRGEFYTVPLQKVPISEWGHVKPREKQVEAFRRVATPLEQQWIADLQSTWNVTRWYGTDMAKKGRRNRREQKAQQHASNPEEASSVRPKWAQQQRAFWKQTEEIAPISIEAGPHRTTRRKIGFILRFLQSKGASNLDLYSWKTETVQKCLHWLQAVIGTEERTRQIKELEQVLQERLRTKRTRLTHEAQQKKKGGLLKFFKVFHTNKLINAARLRQVPHDESVTKLHPDPKAADALQVCDKLTVPLLRKLGNFTQVAYRLQEVDFQKQEIPCQGCNMLKKATDAREVEGHWVALDPNFINEPRCREWLANGAKYRLDKNSRGVMVAIREGLDQYIEVYLHAYGGKEEDAVKLEKWKGRI